MGLQSQRHIRDHIFETVSDAENSGRVFECCFVKETKTYYEFVSSLPEVIDHKRILATGQNGFSRWKAIAGKYAFDYKFPKKRIVSADILYLTRYSQYTVYGEFTIEADSTITLEADTDLVVV